LITITDIDSENIIEKNGRVRVCSKKIVKSIDKKTEEKKRAGEWKQTANNGDDPIKAAGMFCMR